MLESDVYSNTTLEDLYGPLLAKVHELDAVDESLATYAIVNSTFQTVLHELGHLLRIGHIRVSGNIMSHNYMPALARQWKIPMGLYISGMAEMRRRLTGGARRGLLRQRHSRGKEQQG